MLNIKAQLGAFTGRLRSLQKHPRLDALGNRIEMRLTFEEWLQIWVDSGKIHLRGAGHGKYCMSRINDIGHYELGNVFIQLQVENTRQAHLGKKRRPETVERMNKSLEGKRQGERNGFYGKKHSAETLARLSISHSGPVSDVQRAAQQEIASRKVTCPHCGMTSNGPAMRRWHFGNCRHA